MRYDYLILLAILVIIPFLTVRFLGRRLAGRHWTIRMLTMLLALYVILVAAMAIFQRTLLYPADQTPWTAPSGWEKITTSTSDGLTLAHLYKPPAKPDQGLIILFHGNAGNAVHRTSKGDALATLGWGVLLAEFRGYGGNPGAPTEDGLTRDGESVMAWAKTKGFQADQIVIYGESVGTGVATAMAVNTPPKALILEAPYISVPEAAQNIYPFLPARWLVLDQFNNLSRMPQIKAPLLVLQGENDEVIPVSHGRAVLAAANEPKTGAFMSGLHHNDVFYLGGAVPVKAFLNGLK